MYRAWWRIKISAQDGDQLEVPIHPSEQQSRERQGRDASGDSRAVTVQQQACRRWKKKEKGTGEGKNIRNRSNQQKSAHETRPDETRRGEAMRWRLHQGNGRRERKTSSSPGPGPAESRKHKSQRPSSRLKQDKFTEAAQRAFSLLASPPAAEGKPKNLRRGRTTFPPISSLTSVP